MLTYCGLIVVALSIGIGCNWVAMAIHRLADVIEHGEQEEHKRWKIERGSHA